jgi:hypothetical protein
MRSRKFDMQLLRRRISSPRRVIAYARAPLIAFLRERLVALSASPRLILTDVIDGSSDHEPMCRFTVDGDAQARSFVAPLSQLSFGRSVRLARSLCAKPATERE